MLQSGGNTICPNENSTLPEADLGLGQVSMRSVILLNAERCGIRLPFLSTSSPLLWYSVRQGAACCTGTVMGLLSIAQFLLPWMPATGHCQVQLGIIFSRAHTVMQVSF